MYTGISIGPPLFEIGLKAYMYGEKAAELAKAADKASARYGVTIVFSVQAVDIPRIARETEHLLVFAQHVDPVAIGRGNGSVLPEAVKDAGAHGTLLNHAEKRMNLNDIHQAIRRADEAGLLSMVCADSPEQGAAIAHLAPNLILAEPPDLIGGESSVGKDASEFIPNSIALIKQVNPDVLVLNSAGIRTAADVAEVVQMGAEATGCTSGIVLAEDPIQAMEDMIRAMSETWYAAHPRA